MSFVVLLAATPTALEQGRSRAMNALPLTGADAPSPIEVKGDGASCLALPRPDGSGVLQIRAADGGLAIVVGSPFATEGRVRSRLEQAARHDSRRMQAEIERLEGAFCAVTFAPHGAVTVRPDRFGFYPVYAGERDGVTCLASRAVLVDAALGDATPGEEAMSPAGWMQLMLFGHPMLDDTLFAGVRRLAPGDTLDRASREATPRWRQGNPWPPWGGATTLSGATDDLLAAMRRDVRQYRDEYGTGTLLLSGGFDSRILLWLLQECGGTPRLVVHDHADELGDADGAVARAVAAALRLPITSVRSPHDFFRTPAYRRYVRQSEVATTSLYLFIAQVAAMVRAEMEVLWEGLTVGFLTRYFTRAGAASLYAPKLVRAAPRRLAQLGQLFTPDFAASLEDARLDTLRRLEERYGSDPAGAHRFFVENRGRRRTGVNPLKVYESMVPVAFGALSADVVAASFAALGVSPHERDVAAQIFTRHLPHAYRIPLVTGSTIRHPFSRGAWRVPAVAATGVMHNSRAMRSALRRLASRTGTPAFARVSLDDDGIERLVAQSAVVRDSAIDSLRGDDRKLPASAFAAALYLSEWTALRDDLRAPSAQEAR